MITCCCDVNQYMLRDYRPQNVDCDTIIAFIARNEKKFSASANSPLGFLDKSMKCGTEIRRCDLTKQNKKNIKQEVINLILIFPCE